MRTASVLLLLLVLTFALTGCFTLALKGTEVASKAAAQHGPPGVREVGQVTYSGTQKIESAKDKAIDAIVP